MATNQEWALKMIPVLVRWAQGTWDVPHHYSDLSAAVGHKTDQIGDVLGRIQDIFNELGKQYKKEIPTLNSLVSNKSSNLPSEGFDYVIPGYSALSPAAQKGEIRRLNEKAHQYDWEWVLKALGLQPAKIFSSTDLAKIKKTNYGTVGEGKEHKSIKKYICSHPESIGIENVIVAQNEYNLLSGDRIDVYFECEKNEHIAIEVKPSNAPEFDIMRGIFQCIKYKAVMDASRCADYGNYDNEVILVIAGTMSAQNKQIANDLSIHYIEQFEMK